MIGWVLYAIAFVAFLVWAWRRIGAFDRASEELERRRNRRM